MLEKFGDRSRTASRTQFGGRKKDSHAALHARRQQSRRRIGYNIIVAGIGIR